MLHSLIVVVLFSTKQTATHCSSVPLFLHFSFPPIKVSVANFSASIGVKAFTFCVHLQVDKVYCVNENLDANLHFVFFFKFSIFPSVTPLQYIWTFVSVKYYLTKDSEIHTQLDSDEMYYVAKKATYCLSVPLFVHFSFSTKKFLSQISQLLSEPVLSNYMYTIK